jgi:hypothetical protein
MSAYRWHLVDPVPFTKSLRVEIEHKGWAYNPDGRVKTAFGERQDLMSSVAYWYQKGIASGQPPVPYGSARLPHGNVKQLEAEASPADVRGEKGKVSVSKELFWGKDVLLFEAEGPGARVEVPFVVDESGLYELSTQVAQAPDYGQYEILVDGQAAAPNELEHEPGADIRQQNRFDGYAWDTYVGLDRQLGWRKLDKGRHTLTFVCTGRNPASSGFTLGVDNVILARVGADGWALAKQVKEPRLAATDVPGIVKALKSDPDEKVRTQAALALAARPNEAAAALPDLEAALKDPSPFVREAAARAIGAQGPAAAHAVPALVAACKDPAQAGSGPAQHLLCARRHGQGGGPRYAGVAQARRPERDVGHGEARARRDRRQVGAEMKVEKKATLLLPAAAASAALTIAASSTPASRVRFTVTYAQDKSAAPLDGRLLLILSKDPTAEPRTQITESVRKSQQVFGVDVESWKAGAPAALEGDVLGFPAESLADVPPGTYQVQALLHRYETFRRADGHVVKLPMDRGEGQQWSKAPGNLYSTPKSITIEKDEPATFAIELDQVIPPIPEPAATKYVRHERIRSERLSKFWGRDMYLGAHVLLPEGSTSTRMLAIRS